MVQAEHWEPVDGFTTTGLKPLTLGVHRRGKQLAEFVAIPILPLIDLGALGLLQNDLRERVRSQVVVAIREPEQGGDRAERLFESGMSQRLAGRTGKSGDVLFPLPSMFDCVLGAW